MPRRVRRRAATGSRSKEFFGAQSSTKGEAAIPPGIRSWRKNGLAYGRLSRRGSTPTISTTPAVNGVRFRSFVRDQGALTIHPVDGLLVHGQRRLVNGFGQRGMRMNGPLDILGAGRVFHRKDGFADEFA